MESYRQPRTRFINLAIIGILIAGITFPIFDHLYQQSRYRLDTQLTSLISGTSPIMAEKITYDRSKSMYQFNKAGIKAASAGTEPSQSVGGGDESKLYAADIHKDGRKGVTIYDTVNDVQLGFRPLFATNDAEQSGNHFVLPLSGQAPRLVYTAKANGLKEDIILTTTPSADTMSYSYQLTLPEGLEARLTPDGGVGVYSANSALYGNITYGSDADRARVEAARKHGIKDNLVFFIPSPVIKQSGKASPSTKARFSLSDGTLTLTATGLRAASYPLSIDPSIVVTSSNEFRTGDSENIEIDTTNGLIRRAGLTGGLAGSWTTDTKVAPASSTSITLSYGKYLYYMISGSASYAEIYEAPVAGSMLSNWTSIPSPPSASNANSFAAYNGYMYSVLGGNTRKASYAKINKDGSLGTWVTGSTTFSVNRDLYGVETYNGYIYVIGGQHTIDNFPLPDTIINHNEVEFARLNADGTVGTWASTSALVSPRRYASAQAYNGYMYAINGASDAGTGGREAEYAPINADGTLGAWVASANVSVVAHSGASGRIYKGYMYKWGQWDNGATMEYAPINADGSIGVWNTSPSNFSVGRGGIHGGVIANDYIFVIGGSNGGSSSTYNDIQYALIKPAGELTGATTGNTFTTARFEHGTVINNGYIYVVGGCITTTCGATDVLSSIYYAQIASDGSVGTWSSTTALTTGRGGFGIAAYNGYLYVLGGIGTLGQNNTVMYAPFNTNGTIGTWLTSTNSFATARSFNSVVIYAGYIYTLGGTNGTITNYDDVQYAQINISSGDVGAWNSTTAFAGSRFNFGVDVYSGRMYLTGGCGNTNSNCSGGTGILLDAQYATINSNGTLSSWTTNAAGLGTARWAHKMFAYKGYLYVSGGNIGSNIYGKINTSTGSVDAFVTTGSHNSMRDNAGMAFYRDKLYVTGGKNSAQNLNNDVQWVVLNNGGPGTVGSWATASSLITARNAHTSFVAGGKVWVMGGCAIDQNCTNGNFLSSTEYATLNTDGTISSWTAGPNLRIARERGTAIYLNGFVYQMGGVVSDTVGTASVDYAKVNSDGTFSSDSCGTAVTWCQAADLPVATFLHKSVAYNGVIYVAGGTTGNKVRYATPNNTGNITSWFTTTDLPDTRYWGGETFAANGYLYVLGGCVEASCTTLLNSTLSAPINTDGSLGSWTYGSGLVYKSRVSATVIINGYVYLVGGQGRGAVIEFAPLLPAGGLGKWQTTTAMPGGHSEHTSIIANGFIYAIGGNGPPINTVRYAPLQSIPRIARYTQQFDLEADTGPTRFRAGGSLSYGNPDVSLAYELTNNANTLVNSSQYNLALNTSLTLPAILGRYAKTRLKLDDTATAVFPDNNQTTITDLELYYRLPTRSRLLRGKGFSNEVLRPLDTEGP